MIVIENMGWEWVGIKLKMPLIRRGEFLLTTWLSDDVRGSERNLDRAWQEVYIQKQGKL